MSLSFCTLVHNNREEKIIEAVGKPDLEKYPTTDDKTMEITQEKLRELLNRGTPPNLSYMDL